MPSADRPDILLLMTDQQRGDCLGCAGHPFLQTPHLDGLAAEGVRFPHAYSECPVCVPARRTLMTGRFPANHGVVMNHIPETPLPGPTLPGMLAEAGYHTHLCGKLHLTPLRKLHGFMSADWADNTKSAPKTKGGRAIVNDYQRFIEAEGPGTPGFSDAHGLSANTPVVRPWHGEERLHFTNWVTDSALRFLERRDPTLPFFLKVSYLHPHPPCTPPEAYFDRYSSFEYPERPVGNWARVFDAPPAQHPRDPHRICLPRPAQQQLEAAYYASINHIDDQISRILIALPRPDETLIVFVSDHGEMLGDHQWFRKHVPWEGAARIPFILRPPKSWGLPPGRLCGAPVQLADVMPTLLAAAGIGLPESVDGTDLRPVMEGGPAPREHVHGEIAEVPTLDSGMHYLTDGKRKYIWFPGRGEEQFFDLESDPAECHNRAADSALADEVARWRGALVQKLANRPEGFVQNGRLARLNGPTAFRPFH